MPYLHEPATLGELEGFWKNVKKAFTPPNWLKDALTPGKDVKRIFSGSGFKEMGKKIEKFSNRLGEQVKNTFTISKSVQGAFKEGGPIAAWQEWIDTEADKGIERFAEQRTLITPQDVILSPLHIMSGGATTALGRAAVKGFSTATKAIMAYDENQQMQSSIQDIINKAVKGAMVEAELTEREDTLDYGLDTGLEPTGAAQEATAPAPAVQTVETTKGAATPKPFYKTPAGVAAIGVGGLLALKWLKVFK